MEKNWVETTEFVARGIAGSVGRCGDGEEGEGEMNVQVVGQKSELEGEEEIDT